MLSKIKAWFKRRKERKNAADNKKFFNEVDSLGRVLAWDYCNPYKWHNTELYCREHDGPELDDSKKLDLALRRREYLRTGNKDLLIDQDRRRDLDHVEENTERRFRERMAQDEEEQEEHEENQTGCDCCSSGKRPSDHRGEDPNTGPGTQSGKERAAEIPYGPGKGDSQSAK